ncbi:CDP-glycerol glycerophosphotransferase family protein [Aliikangiella sp. IMCC44653]
MTKKRYLFYISQNYSFEILRPIQQEIIANGDECAWFVEGGQVNLSNFNAHEQRLPNIQAVQEFNPIAVFVPGNIVPNFIPGLKVQVFHGLEWKKKGHFRIRGFFDLYCTQGEITTTRFKQLAENHQNFHVIETGWSKLDPLFTTPAYPLTTDKPVILYAPTFSPNLTSALELLAPIKQMAATGKHHWLIKFHPKMNPDWIAEYRAIESDNLEIVDIDSCLPLLQRADILVSDTSSMVGEFLLLDKPAVTFNNASPGDYLINITEPLELSDAIQQALTPSTLLSQKIAENNHQLHPYNDGQSSARILQAVDYILTQATPLKKTKPLNLLRSFKLRKKLNYWKI